MIYSRRHLFQLTNFYLTFLQKNPSNSCQSCLVLHHSAQTEASQGATTWKGGRHLSTCDSSSRCIKPRTALRRPYRRSDSPSLAQGTEMRAQRPAGATAPTPPTSPPGMPSPPPMDFLFIILPRLDKNG